MDVMSFWGLVEAAAQDRGGALMAIDERGHELTFGDLRDRAERVAAGIQALGIGPGDTVSWQLPSWLDTVVLVAALSRLDVVQNPLVPIYRQREVAFITRETGTSLLVVPGVWNGVDYESSARAAAAPCPGVEVLVVQRGGFPTGDPATLGPPPDGSADPVRWLFYSSGTTADPKGARHTDRNLLASAAAWTRWFGFSSADRFAYPAPVSHIGGATLFISSMLCGMPFVINETFDPEATPELFRRTGVTIIAGTHVVHRAVLDVARRHPGERWFPSVRGFMGGGAPKPPGLHEALRDEVGTVGLVSGYGATECSLAVFCTFDDADEKLRVTEGRPVGELRVSVAGPGGVLLPPGEVGELLLQGPQLFLGYVDPALDESAFDPEGRFRTGDLGYLDPDGYVVVTGRLKEIVIRKGENISTREVQEVLLRHAQVADCAVIGLPDPVSGERVCAIVVNADPDAPLGFEAMVQFCREQGLMNQKIPEQLELVDELPRNAMGKVMAAALKERFTVALPSRS
jgi:acyl-CoA synthetase (AMP-forming)/AMP-acid ligase II